MRGNVLFKKNSALKCRLLPGQVHYDILQATYTGSTFATFREWIKKTSQYASFHRPKPLRQGANVHPPASCRARPLQGLRASSDCERNSGIPCPGRNGLRLWHKNDMKPINVLVEILEHKLCTTFRKVYD